MSILCVRTTLEVGHAFFKLSIVCAFYVLEHAHELCIMPKVCSWRSPISLTIAGLKGFSRFG